MKMKLDEFPALGKRQAGFKKIFQLLARRCRTNGPLLLVETGCLRALNWEGDGCSTILFHAFAVQTGSRLVSLEKEPAHGQFARRHCPKAKIICGDSVATLHRQRRQLQGIDFLYLDSMDVDWNNPHPSALHHLMELCAALPLLKPDALIFVDDHQPGNGKPIYVMEYLNRIGARRVFEEYQVGYQLR